MKAELKKKLECLFKELKSKKFPAFLDNSQLSNWIMDLILVDAEIAGHASTLLGGSRIDKKSIPNLKEEERSLHRLKVTKSEELEALKECQEYLSLLMKIREILLQEGNGY